MTLAADAASFSVITTISPVLTVVDAEREPIFSWILPDAVAFRSSVPSAPTTMHPLSWMTQSERTGSSKAISSVRPLHEAQTPLPEHVPHFAVPLHETHWPLPAQALQVMMVLPDPSQTVQGRLLPRPLHTGQMPLPLHWLHGVHLVPLQAEHSTLRGRIT